MNVSLGRLGDRLASKLCLVPGVVVVVEVVVVVVVEVVVVVVVVVDLVVVAFMKNEYIQLIYPE